MALLSSKFTLKEHPSELPKYWQEGSQHFKQVYNSFELGHILDTWACVAYVLSHAHLAEWYAHYSKNSDLSNRLSKHADTQPG